MDYKYRALGRAGAILVTVFEDLTRGCIRIEWKLAPRVTAFFDRCPKVNLPVTHGEGIDVTESICWISDHVVE